MSRLEQRSEGGFLLGKAARLSEKMFSRLLKEEGVEGIEAGQGRIVFLLWRKGPLGQTELASLAGLDKSSLALTLDRLEAKGLVERSEDESDARRSIVSVRPRATEALEAYEVVSQRMNDIFYRGFSLDEIGLFEAQLSRLIANLEGEN